MVSSRTNVWCIKSMTKQVFFFCFFCFFEREFQPMASAADDSSLSSDQDTN